MVARKSNETKKNFKQKVRKLSIWWKLLVPTNVVVVLLCVTLSMFANNTLEEEMIKMGQVQSQTVAALAAVNLDADVIAQLTEPGMESTDLYKAQQQVLINIQEKGNVLYIYTLFTEQHPQTSSRAPDGLSPAIATQLQRNCLALHGNAGGKPRHPLHFNACILIKTVL